jgi:hypothetical protein
MGLCIGETGDGIDIFGATDENGGVLQRIRNDRASDACFTYFGGYDKRASGRW